MHTRRKRFWPKAVSVELRRLPWRLFGLLLTCIAAAFLLALLSWYFADPSLNHATQLQPRNWLGFRGASAAATLMEGFGLAAPLVVLPLAALGIQIALGYSQLRPRLRLSFWAASLLTAPAFFASFATPQRWLLGVGLGGISGDFTAARIAKFAPVIPPLLLWPSSALVFFVLGALCVWRACGMSGRDLALAFQRPAGMKGDDLVFGESHSEPEASKRVVKRLTGWTRFRSARNRALVRAGPRELWMTKAESPPLFSPPVHAGEPARDPAAAAREPPRSMRHSPFTEWGKALRSTTEGEPEDTRTHPREARPGSIGFWDSDEEREERDASESRYDDGRIEPFFGPGRRSPSPGDTKGGGWHERNAPVSAFLRLTGKAAKGAHRAAGALTSVAARFPIIHVKNAVIAHASSLNETAPRSGGPVHPGHLGHPASPLPPLSLLASYPESSREINAADSALVQRAASLMRVLGDFGVKGRISGVHPGPVITLFELEPARGTKLSRIAGLADDIARSMTAPSARIAAVPGRDVIGIELPNPVPEAVSLRSVLESPAFVNSQAALPLALGKSIGGDSVIADLARMPHLLVAGTTGSGKSVGINTMILSLLFRLPAAQCKFILIDPKRLELSVYNGIPHLLVPVVTEPKKAVAALKWAVGEMNSRYECMSKLGVRNIAGYNSKMAAAQLKGEPLRRTVQSGFHHKTGKLIEEEEFFEPVPMPYLVIVIDEMADLMMCAGKDVEAAVQRLSQMARAAGIHMILATQRPSVDILTGTIKANLPSRISYQVSSKIDSRTIIGEQGAEQLLGSGDMLYVAPGGRMVRVHGPFAGDREIEAVAHYLRMQGSPSYRPEILEDRSSGSDANSRKRRFPIARPANDAA